MGKKRLCAHCRADITHRNFVQFVVDGNITKFCNVDCYKKELAKRAKEAANGVNRMCNDDNIRVR